MAEYKNDDVELAAVYKAPNEFMAKTIESLLRMNGIEVIVKSFQVPMYDSIVTYIKGDWGEILVRKEDDEKAKELINGFLEQGSK